MRILHCLAGIWNYGYGYSAMDSLLSTTGNSTTISVIVDRDHGLQGSITITYY